MIRQVKERNKMDEVKFMKNVPSGRRQPRALVKGGKGALFTSYGSLAQFLEMKKNSFFHNLSEELRPLIKLNWGPLDKNW